MINVICSPRGRPKDDPEEDLDKNEQIKKEIIDKLKFKEMNEVNTDKLEVIRKEINIKQQQVERLVAGADGTP